MGGVNVATKLRMHDLRSSAFRSLEALSGPPPPTADLARPEALRAAVRARSYKGELILFSFDFCGISEALSLVLSLRRAGFEHFLPLSDGLETCAELQRAAAARGSGVDRPFTVPCYFSSWPRDHDGWRWWGTAPGCVSAARASHSCVLEQLWATRYHVAAQLLAERVNLLHMDTDSVVLADPYALLKAPPLSNHNLIVLKEQPANGGMWYAQNTLDGAGAQWVIAEVARRTLDVIKLSTAVNGPPRRYLPPFDQAMLGDVLYTAADDGNLHWGAACEHRVLRSGMPLCATNASEFRKRMRWTERPRATPPSAALAASLFRPLKEVERGGAAGRRIREGATAPSASPWTSKLLASMQGSFLVAQLRVRGQARVESVATSPPWLFPSAWTAQRQGLYGRQPPALAVAHLLGVRCRWCESSEDPDHGAKWEWQQLSGFWPDGAYTLAPPLRERGGGGGGSREGARDFGVLGSPLPERFERHCVKKGRARLLYADRKVLSASPAAVIAAESADDDGASARVLVRRLVALAGVMGRMAVLPSFNCSAPWVRKGTSSDGAVAVSDLRVVVTDVARGAPLHQQRCAPCNVQMACRQHVLSEAQLAAATRARLGGEPAPPPRRLALPLERSSGGRSIVSLPSLWRGLRTAGDAHHLQLSFVGPIVADACSLDLAMLTDEEELAKDVTALHCHVADPMLPKQALCPRTSAAVSASLTDWSRALKRAVRGGGGGDGVGPSSAPKCGGDSLLSLRLGGRCSDLLCSDSACFVASQLACVERLDASIDRAFRMERCEAWLRALPRGVAPMCDALSGRCIPPPLAFPGRIRWPAAPCLNAPPRSMCMDEAARHPPGSCSGYAPNQKCRACSACVLAPRESKKGLGRGARRGGRVL